ncbi:MAG: OmpH family outer membrane protein [Bacteroidota bacterium]
MKKTLLILALIVLGATLQESYAQTKIGYVSLDQVVGYMPELAPEKFKKDTVGQQFVKDSIMPRLNYIQSEYQKKLQEYTDTTKPKSVRDIIGKELQSYQDELSQADAFIQEVLQYKQQEFLGPFYAKAQKAVESVAKKKGYAYVVTPQAFLVAPEQDNLLVPVLTELGIKIPAQLQQPAPKPTGKN